MARKNTRLIHLNKILRISDKKLKKVITYSIIVLGTLVFVVGLLLAVYWKPTRDAIKSGTTGKNSFLKAQNLILTQDFSGAQIELGNAVTNFESAKKSFQKLLWLENIPWVGAQVNAIENLLLVGITTGQSMKEVAAIASLVATPLTKNDRVSLAVLSVDEKHQLLKNIYNAKPKLEEAKISIDKAVSFSEKIPNHGLIKKIHDIIDPLKKQLPQLQSGLDQAVTLSQALPLVAGYPEAKTYLFLLENNSELAPSGGLIGTYGILKIKDGEITSFVTDNVYNLDDPAKAWLNIDAPWPVAKYNVAPKLFLRGASWSPDFPTTGQSAQWFYKAERGPEKKLDGTIAITPTFIQSLLSITGEVKVNGLTFTSKNFTDVLQEQVERKYLQRGITASQLSQRKEIIGVLSKKILDDVLTLPQNRWAELWGIIHKNIEQKQILLYANNEYTQSLILKENWGGQIQSVEHDYLSIIDANLASLKSDPVVKRLIDYKVRREGSNDIADLSFTYKNEGTITWKTTRYRTYVRVYVPDGSTLIKSEGAMVECKNKNEGKIETTNELGKTVFGTFVCTEPGASRTLHLTYKLPERVSKQIDQGQYNLLVQKQAGTANYPLQFEMKTNKRVTDFMGFDAEISPDKNSLKLLTDLSGDRRISVTLE